MRGGDFGSRDASLARARRALLLFALEEAAAPGIKRLPASTFTESAEGLHRSADTAWKRLH